ncbi:hypothetical protein Dda_5086 [Drechslerella dactyloides]|uniref:Uncharacterized protein n=1 Tax=Drechslerella dactyloides TaxID=74499 RepID=A0AAD6NID9_DREDA|nr:hypothetical protein Dda_5086 [Drechslerella dactyloides]
MRFATFAATSAAVTGALAQAYYEQPVYHTSNGQVYTSIKTCTDKPTGPTEGSYGAPSSAPGYAAPSDHPVYGAPSNTDHGYGAPTGGSYPVPTKEATYPAPSKGPEYGAEVTYTSYAHITITSCADYVKNCPGSVYTSPVYSVSTCTGETPAYTPPAYSPPAYTPPEYSPPSNNSGYGAPPPVYSAPPTYTAPPTYGGDHGKETLTTTYYTTVCPGANYCYATTVTSTYCPNPTPAPPHEVPTYAPAPPPVYSAPAPVYSAPAPHYSAPAPPPTYGQNATSTYAPPPSYTGAASVNAVSFGVAAIAGLAALLIAA